MRKSTWVLSLAMSLFILCLVVFAIGARDRVRGQPKNPAAAEESPPELQEDRSDISPDDGQLPIQPPRLGLDLLRNDEQQPLPEKVSEVVSGRIEALDAVLTSQVQDSTWANDMMSSYRAVYDGLEGASLDSLVCGQTLCRLEIATALDEEASTRAKSRLEKAVIPTGEHAIASTAPPMPPKLVVYLARENNRLPFPVQVPNPF